MAKGDPVYGAHSDNVNQVFSILGVIGTLGTSDTGGTANTLPVSVNEQGMLYTSSLVGYSEATVTVGSGGTSGTTTSTITGMIYKITQAVGTLSGTPGTQNTYLIDSLGGTIAALPAQAESGTITISTTVPVSTGMSWRVDTTGDPDGTQVASRNVLLGIHYQS